MPLELLQNNFLLLLDCYLVILSGFVAKQPALRLFTMHMPNKKPLASAYISMLLPLCFLCIFMLFDYAYQALSDQTLRLYYHDYFITFCTYIINTIAPEDGVEVIQNAIISSKANLAIVRTCDGSSSFFIISAAILTFRSTLRLTLMGIVAGFMLVLLLNSVRIISLYFLMAYNTTWFSYTHLTIAPFLLISMSCGYFSIWAYYANEVKHGNA